MVGKVGPNGFEDYSGFGVTREDVNHLQDQIDILDTGKIHTDERLDTLESTVGQANAILEGI